MYVDPEPQNFNVIAPSKQADSFEPAYMRGLTPVTAVEFVDRDIPPIELAIVPFLPTKGLCMIHAPRGIGKTHVSIGIACAIASGLSFLNWHAPKPRRVLFIDGEMPAVSLQERLMSAAKFLELDAQPANLTIVAADMEADGLPDLSDANLQHLFDDSLVDVDVIILDNLSTICRTIRENDADTWEPVQAWLLRMRRAGKSVVVIHHSGKTGAQRGTSRKEDILDSVITLKHPLGYQASQGARFEVHYEKHRGFFGDDAEPFEAWLKPDGWQVQPVQNSPDDVASLQALQEDGRSVREIAKETGISKSSVQRRLSRPIPSD